MATSEIPAVRRRDGVAVIDLAGDVNRAAEETLEAAWGQAVAEQPGAVVLNFEGAGYINSTGIAVIVGLLARARAAGIEVRAYGLTPHYRRSSRSPASPTSWRSTPTRTAPCAARKGAGMPEATATFEVRRHGPAAIVDIRGDVTAGSEGRADERLRGDRRRQGGGPELQRPRVHEQWRHRPAGDAAGARQPALQRLLAYGLSDHYAQIFELTRLDEAVGIHDTESDALAAAGAA
jgi:anti-anti-sigma factor